MNVYAGIALLLLACVGNAAWWAILVNRIHSFPFQEASLKFVRKLHDAGIILFPPFIFWMAGCRRPGLLHGAFVADLSGITQCILLYALCGVVPFTWAVARWHMRRQPQQLLEVTSQHFDVLNDCQTDAEKKLVRGDRVPFLARFPMNEVYRLEVTRKRLRFTGRQSREAGHVRTIKVAHFSDTHFAGCPGKRFFEFATDRLCELQPDIFVFTGDLIDDEALFPWASEMFTRLSGVATCYSILGNHDWRLDYSRIRQGIVGAGWIDIGQQQLTARVGDVTLLIAGTEAPWIERNPEVPTPNTEDIRILLSHSPDQRNFAVANQFDLMLCGHNHGGQVVLPGIGPVYSPSKYGVKYAGGTYRRGQMLIHVSRGLAAKEALRWNACPEITLLEIEIS
ncbi:MAG: metallophosphoesterase [Fuerstiella sp.]